MLRTVAAILLFPATAGLAQTAGVASAGAADPGQKRVCRTMTPTGSIMTKRVCHTRKEWDALTTASQRKMDERRTDNTVDRSQGRGSLLN